MINSTVSGISGFNANAHTMSIASAKQKTGEVSGQKNGLGTEDYWTPDRMRQAVPPDMGRVVPESEAKPHIPEQSKLPQESSLGIESGNVPQFDGYWTPDRMRQAVPPDMGRAVPESDAQPHIPEQSELPQEPSLGIESGSVPQFDGYWTPERMREAVPPDMGRAVPQPDVKPHIPEQSELPEDGNTVSISGYEPNPKEYWTPERMRDAVPPDMGRAVPESEAKPHIPEQSKLPQEMNPGIVSGSVPQFDGYWTPDRMREAMPPDMGRAVPQPDVKSHIPEQNVIPAEAKPAGKPGSLPQDNPRPINIIA